MQSFVFKQSFVSLTSMQFVYDLAARCEAADGYPTKIYWHALHERKDDNNALDYLCLHNNKVIGMLNILFFAESVEITALIDPEFRQQGLFNKMLRIALVKLRNYIVSHYTFICNAKFTSFIEKCIAKGAIKDHHEIEMLAPQTLPLPGKQALSLHKADNNDIPMLANIHEQCFLQPNAETMEKRFAVTLLESNRQVFLAKNKDNAVIGKIHVREDYNRIYLHDVAILPAYQRQGYGYALMVEWLLKFAKNYSKPIIVEVLGHNTAALQLYSNCGFVITNTYEFWKFPFNQ